MKVEKMKADLNIPWYRYSKEFGNFTWNYDLDKYIEEVSKYALVTENTYTLRNLKNYINMLVEHDIKRALRLAGLYKEDRWSEIVSLNKKVFKEIQDAVIEDLFEE